jgi:hypothetical protein
MCSPNHKIVVFDLDETLGYFMELGIFWDALKAFITHSNLEIQINQILFNNVLNLFPEFLRPNIMNILKYVIKKKKQNKCDKIMIYTNNQGPKEWVKYIMNYFEEKLNYKIFDKIIFAFKIKGERVELCRTTHLKTHIDLINCTKIHKNTQICFLDDVFYPHMNSNIIYYINVKSYTYDLPFNEMITRMFNANILIVLDTFYCKEFMLSFMKTYNYIYISKSIEAQNNDKIVSQKILYHLRIFFKMKNDNNDNKTRKQVKFNKNIKQKNKSIKNRSIKNTNMIT